MEGLRDGHQRDRPRVQSGGLGRSAHDAQSVRFSDRRGEGRAHIVVGLDGGDAPVAAQQLCGELARAGADIRDDRPRTRGRRILAHPAGHPLDQHVQQCGRISGSTARIDRTQSRELPGVVGSPVLRRRIGHRWSPSRITTTIMDQIVETWSTCPQSDHRTQSPSA